MLAIDKSDVGCVCNNGVVVCKVDGGEAEDGGSRTGNEEEGDTKNTLRARRRMSCFRNINPL